VASRPKFCPRPRPRRFVIGLGLSLEDLSSASASASGNCPRLTSPILCNWPLPPIVQNRSSAHEQEIVSGDGICWAICKSAPCPDRYPRQHPSTQILQVGCPSYHPTNSVKALKADHRVYTHRYLDIYLHLMRLCISASDVPDFMFFYCSFYALTA